MTHRCWRGPGRKQQEGVQAASGAKAWPWRAASEEARPQSCKRQEENSTSDLKVGSEAESALGLPGKAQPSPHHVRPLAKDLPRCCVQTSGPQNCEIINGYSCKLPICDNLFSKHEKMNINLSLQVETHERTQQCVVS